MAHHDFPDQVDRTGGAGCCAIGCVVAMAGVTGFLLLVAWAFAPWIGEALA